MQIEACVPLFRTELKDDACTQVTAYYRLSPNCVDTTKALMVNHIYHFSQHFDVGCYVLAYVDLLSVTHFAGEKYPCSTTKNAILC